jgi:hypothetical protein
MDKTPWFSSGSPRIEIPSPLPYLVINLIGSGDINEAGGSHL